MHELVNRATSPVSRGVGGACERGVLEAGCCDFTVTEVLDDTGHSLTERCCSSCCELRKGT